MKQLVSLCFVQYKLVFLGEQAVGKTSVKHLEFQSLRFAPQKNYVQPDVDFCSARDRVPICCICHFLVLCAVPCSTGSQFQLMVLPLHDTKVITRFMYDTFDNNYQASASRRQQPLLYFHVFLCIPFPLAPS